MDYPSECFIFFDADIIINDKKFIHSVEKAINSDLLCVAVDGIVPQHDYRRYVWHQIHPGALLQTEHPWYYNAGFFAGNKTSHLSLLIFWDELIKTHIKSNQFLYDNEDFPMMDQDMFNAVLQHLKLDKIMSFSRPDWLGIATQVNPFFQIGNFRPYAFVHCTGKHKPWNMKGIPTYGPSEYDEKWYKFIFDKNNAIKTTVHLTKLQHSWFRHSLITRIIRKIKKSLQ